MSKHSDPKSTPMMRQYFEIKNRHPDKYLFFRLGDFYEMFDQDAIEVSAMLQITLTERHQVPMCGIPYHQLHRYAHKVIALGKKIVIVEQDEKPSGGGLVTRRIAQIITPGTTIDEMNLNAGEKNFLVSCYFPSDSGLFADGEAGMVALETTTGEVIFETAGDGGELHRALRRFFENYKPTELVLMEGDRGAMEELVSGYPHIITNYGPEPKTEAVEKKITSVYQEHPEILDFTPPNYPLFRGLYLLLSYTEENYGEAITYLQTPKRVERQRSLLLDQETLIHLEIFKNNTDHTRKHSLLSVLDHTRTPMGSRKLQESLALPSREPEVIRTRLDQTEYLFREPHYLKELRSWMHHIADMERICSRLGLKRALPRDLLSLRRSLQMAQKVFASLSEKQPAWLRDLDGSGETDLIGKLEGISRRISDTLLEEPGNDLSKGGYTQPQAHPRLQEYHRIKTQGESLLSELENREREQSGIPSLKIRYNDILGYFFETGKSSSQKVPDYFVRKQSLVSSERFVSEELLGLDSQIREARDHSHVLEREVFEEMQKELSAHIPLFQRVSDFIARLDMIAGFAELAATHRWCKPVITTDGVLRIVGGRHPVVEASLKDPFIPNGITIGTPEDMIQIITGPNMSGKSTFLRQNALIVILAHLGCFVPAASAEIPLTDQVFTRIGSGDRLFQGESTFLVEMKETARILNQMTGMSLVIMDEIGRGTSTYDGLALAWSILEYINHRKRAKTLFATHYHELISLTREEGVVHYHVSIREEGDRIVFLKKVVPGVTSRSYGIQVARLAGLPEEVILHAQTLLRELEKKQEQVNVDEVNRRIKENSSKPVEEESPQTLQTMKWVEELLGYDVSGHPPLDTARFLSEMQKKIRGED